METELSENLQPDAGFVSSKVAKSAATNFIEDPSNRGKEAAVPYLEKSCDQLIADSHLDVHS